MPLPGAMPRSTGIVQSVFVATQSRSGVRQRERRLGEIASTPSSRREALHDRGRRVVGGARDREAGLLHHGGEALAADDEDPGARGQPIRQQAHGGLRRGHDLVRLGRRARAPSGGGDRRVGSASALFVM